jgi:hypothetical protein
MPKTFEDSSLAMDLFPLNPLFQQEEVTEHAEDMKPLIPTPILHVNTQLLLDNQSPHARKCTQHSPHSHQLFLPNRSILRMAAHSLLMINLLSLVTVGLVFTTMLCVSVMPLMLVTALTPVRPIVNQVLQLLIAFLLNLVVLARLLLMTLFVL